MLESFIQNGELWLCWDIAKTFTRDGKKNLEMEEYFLKYRNKIKQVHLHDIKNRRSHRTIGEGMIDFQYFLNILKDSNIEDYCIEVRPKSRAFDSLKFLRELLLEKNI